MPLHLIKLCVGVESVEDLEESRDRRVALRASRGEPAVSRHVTRMTPKRQDVSLDEVFDADGTRRCAIVMDPEIVRTAPSPKRPFQGWRYLKASDAPMDLTVATGGLELPDELRRKLIEIGAW